MKFWCTAKQTQVKVIGFEVEAASEDEAWEKAESVAMEQDWNAEKTDCDMEVTDVQRGE